LEEFLGLLRVSDRLHCRPWELLEAPYAWITMVLAGFEVERRVQYIEQQQAGKGTMRR